MRFPLGHLLRSGLGLLLLSLAWLHLGSCSDQSTPPAGAVGLRVTVEFADAAGTLRGEGESFVYDRVQARATPFDEVSNEFGAPFIAENEIEPGETSFRLELDVIPASLYEIEVSVFGSVDSDTTLGGLLFFGQETLENVEAGAENAVTVPVRSQVPVASTEVFPVDERMRLSWTEIPDALRYRIRGTNNQGDPFQAVVRGTDTTMVTPPRLIGEPLTRIFRVRGEFGSRSNGAFSREVDATIGEAVAPGEIPDLAATAITDSSLVLTWTAPGDDGNVGRALLYELRFSNSPIDETTFPDALPVPNVPSPAPAGTAEFVEVGGLNANTVYFFGLVAIDNADLRSPLAVTNATTAPEPDRTPPATIADLRTTDVTGTSARLLWTAPGDDGAEGQATDYDARFSNSPITLESFELADPIPGFPDPAFGGSAENFLLTGLAPRLTWFVGIRTEDDEGNLSGIATTQFETPDLVAPDAVADLEAEALDENRVALSWTAPADDDGSAVARYDLRWSETEITESNFGEAAPVEATTPADPGTGEAVVVGGFSRETELYFALRSFDGSENGSALSNLASTTTPDLTPPSRVLDLVASVIDETTLLVTWTATGDDGGTGTAESYDLRLSTTPIDETNFESANRIPLAVPQPAGTEESIEVSGLITGQLYYLRLRVRDDAGNPSELSDLASGTPTDFIPPAAAVLTVEMTSTDAVDLGWIAPGDDGDVGQAALYDLRYSTTPIDELNFGDAISHSLPTPAPAGSAETTQVTELAEATTYYFALLTEDEVGNRSPLSNVVSATTGTAPPAAPTGLAAAPLSPTSIGLVWQDNSDNETNYEVERRRSDEPSFSRIAVLDPGDGVVTYDDVPVLDRETYTYRVRATNAGGPSAYSNEATATTPVPVPTEFAAAALASDQIRLTWTFDASDPEGFRIERFGLTDWTTVADVAGDERSHVDVELEYLTTYRYRMVAYDGAQTSARTPEVSEQTPDESPFCSIDPPSLDFGTVSVDSADTLVVTITNTGGQVLTGDVILEDCGGGFSLLDGTSLSLRRGEGRNVRVVFAPLDAGASSCTVVGPGCDPVLVSGIGEDTGPTFWSDQFALGNLGVNGDVRTFEPSLDGFYAGGNFTLAGDQTTGYTAQFINDTWFGMGPTLNAQVRIITDTDFGLYCGGDFTSFSSGPHHIAEWTGSSWAGLSYSPDGSVRALTGRPFGVILGGTFDSDYVDSGEGTSGPPGLAEWIPCIPRRDESSTGDGLGETGGAGFPGDGGDTGENRGCNFYTDVGNADPLGTIEVAVVWQNQLYVGGTFTQIGGQDIAYLARFDNSKEGWQPVGFGSGVNNPVYALYPGQSELWVGGQFTAVDGSSSRGIASWSGTSWTTRTAGEDFRTTYAITEFNGNIVIGGGWSTTNGVQELSRIAEFDGEGWIPLGTGIDAPGNAVVYALLERGGALYVGGRFSSAGGLPANNISRWEPEIPR